MIHHGARPTRISHKDYCFFKNHVYGAVKPPIPNEYSADAGLLKPNQEAQDNEFSPPTPPMPYGCTNFAQAGLTTDLTKQIHNPNNLEAVTHANAKGGIDIRVSLDACTPPTTLKPNRLNWIGQYFNIRAQGIFDWVESFQLAQVTGISVGECRSITWGVPWFPSWEQAAYAGQIMPMPTDTELQAARNGQLPWHNACLSGWKSINGRLVYVCSSWQGDIDPLYFPREVINMVMTIPGTVAYTATNSVITKPLTVDVSWLQWLVSFCRSLLQKHGIL